MSTSTTAAEKVAYEKLVRATVNYGVLGTVCALSVSKYVKQLEDRVTLLENKIASLQ